MKNRKNKIEFTEDTLLKLKTRRLLYTFILENPGLHLREISRKLNIPKTTLSYHLDYLEKQALLIIKKDDNYNRYFIKKDIGGREIKILNIIRVETTRNALLYIMITGTAPQIEIAKELDKDPTTVNFHLKRLLKYDIIEQAPAENGKIYTALRNAPIIERKKSKNEIFYRIKEPEIIEKLLIIYYKKGYYDDIISEAILSYGEDVIKNNSAKRIKTSKEAVEIIEKILYDIFPHPYYP